MLILKEDYEISRMTNSKFYKSFNLMNTCEHLFYTRQDLYFLTIPGLFFRLWALVKLTGPLRLLLFVK